MRYQLEYCPNPDCIQLHVSKRLIRGDRLFYKFHQSEEETLKRFEEEALNAAGLLGFCDIVSELDGMEQAIALGRYHIQLTKAAMFSWDDLLPIILSALQSFVSEDGQIEEKGPPIRPTPEYLDSLREQGCDV